MKTKSSLINLMFFKNSNPPPMCNYKLLKISLKKPNY